MKISKKIILCLIIISITMLNIIGINAIPIYADGEISGIGVSPMKEKIILNPGETYNGSFTVVNPAKNTTDFSYKIIVSPFFATEDYNIVYEDTGDYNQIVDWVTVENTSGILKPNDTEEIKFKIDVPKSAPAGGQYVAIIARSTDSNIGNNPTDNTGVQINQAMGVAHTIFAEVTGTSNHNGRIASISVPSFMFSGKIAGSATIENSGNVHGEAIYKMQVFPLFSSEEVYTNEEDPDTAIILPGRTRYHETTWGETPGIGFFNVVYTVEFEGTTQQINKLVVICPLWLLFAILFVTIGLVIWIVVRIRSHKKSKAEVED